MTIPGRGDRFDPFSLKGSQFQQPLMEFSGACEGCGETPYAKLITQMFGKRLIIANATGCSSIWGGTAGWVPYTKDKQTGKGTAWGNSLFEDNAEYGFGQLNAVKQRRNQLKDRVEQALSRCGETMSPSLRSLLEQWLEFWQVSVMAEKLADQIIPLLEAEKNTKEVAEVLRLKDLLLKPSMWMFGGDGWANDIGYGGIDHVLASGQNCKILVMDTEVYSNTGGQSSKATPMGAVAKFAQGGRTTNKKDLGGLAMAYRHIYVASCAMGANYKQTVQAFAEAEKYDGPALVICYSPCIEHRTKTGMSQMSLDQRDAVECGYWPLYRFHPDVAKKGENPFMLDSKKLTGDVLKFLSKQNRYAQLARASPELAEELQNKLTAHLNLRHENMRAKAAEPGLAAASLKAGLAAPAGEELLILFGTDTGVTEGLAKKFSGMCAERGLKVRKTVDLDEVSDLDELKESAAGAITIVMVSTCGHGDFPQNASLFWSMLASPDIAPGELKDIRYCTFAMGDRSYTDTFCEAGKLIDNRFKELGATQILEMGIGDDRDEDKWETGFNTWLPKFWETIKAPEPVDDGAPKKPLFDLTFHNDSTHVPEQICAPGATLLEVLENKSLTPEGYERDIRHFSLKTEGVDFPFDLGDAVALYYENLPEDVNKALEWFDLKGDVAITAACVSDNVSERHRQAFSRRVTVRQVFTELLDVFGRPTKSFCADLARFATKADEQKSLLSLSQGGDDWKKVSESSFSFFDICSQFPSAKPPLDQIMSIFPLMKPRLYSVASSPFYAPGVLELTIVINQWKAPATQRVVTGSCTRYIQHAPVGSKIAAAAVCGTFKFSEDDKTPMVMVGLGTGIAPVRSFVQDKLYKKNKGIEVGPMVIFYGCRREKEELFYKDEWAMFKKEGVLTELQGAFQFENGTNPPKQVFVSNKMEENPALITDNLMKKPGFFYMCGPAVATPSVQKALKAAVASHGELGAEKSEVWFEELMSNGRYSEESY